MRHLRKNIEFKSVYNKRHYAVNQYFIMYISENSLDENRLGISVSKKVGNSVVRHRITRLVREGYRLHEEMFNSGLDIVVVGRNTAASVSYSETVNALLHLGKKLNILIDVD